MAQSNTEFLKKLQDYRAGKISNTTYGTNNFVDDIENIRKKNREAFEEKKQENNYSGFVGGNANTDRASRITQLSTEKDENGKVKLQRTSSQEQKTAYSNELKAGAGIDDNHKLLDANDINKMTAVGLYKATGAVPERKKTEYEQYAEEYKDYSYEDLQEEASKILSASNQWYDKLKPELEKNGTDENTIAAAESKILANVNKYNSYIKPLLDEYSNKEYAEKYNGYSYDEMENAYNQSTSDSEKEWINNHKYDYSTSKQLQSKYDELIASYNSKYDDIMNSDLSDEKKAEEVAKLNEVSPDTNELKSQIKTKKQEENKQAKYTDIVNDDVRVKTVLQKYYALQKYAELNKMFNATNTDITAVKVKSNSDAYKYIDGLSDSEKTQIESDFKNLSKQGYNTDELYKYYSRERESQENEEENEILQDYANEHSIAGSAASVGLNLVGSIADAGKYIGAEVDYLNGGDGYINPDATNVAKAQLIRETVSEKIGKKVDNDVAAGLAQFLYNTTMSMADFTSTAALSVVPGGQIVGLTMLSTSAGVSAANDVIESGGDVDHAIVTGVAAGIAEALFEKVSLEQLKTFKQTDDIKSIKDVVTNIFKGMFTEGSEEVATDLANAVTDYIINADMNQLEQVKKEYIEQGYSEQQANQKVLLYFAAQLGQDFAGGALSGGVLGGAISGWKYASYKHRNYTDAVELGTEAMASDDFSLNLLIEQAKSSWNEKAQSIVKSIEKNIAKNEGTYKVSPADVGNLIILLSGNTSIEGFNNAIAQTNTEYETNNAAANTTQTQSNTKATTSLKTNTNTQQSESLVNNSQANTELAFGKKYSKGLAATTKDGKQVVISRILESANEYGKSDNTVTLLTNSGEKINSDDVVIATSPYNSLINAAKNFDTNGAQGLVMCYDQYVTDTEKAGKTPNLEEYLKSYDALYGLGKVGITYDSVVKSKGYSKVAGVLGNVTAEFAVKMGNRDGNAALKVIANRVERVRLKDGSLGHVSVKKGLSVDEGKLQTLEAIAIKTGREIVVTDELQETEDGKKINGQYKDGKIYINANIGDYMIATALHEAVHNMAVRVPAEYKVLRKFVFNYYAEVGQNIEDVRKNIKGGWGNKAPTDVAVDEEVVCQAVMALAGNEEALHKAIACKENESILNKVAQALKKIAQSVYNFIKGIGTDKHNEQAQAFMNDAQALMEMADIVSRGLDAARNVEVKEKTNTKYSFAGEKANTANIQTLDEAKTLDEQGKSSEEIRHQTGWFKGYDGKWRFEISDKDMVFAKNGAEWSKNPKVARKAELFNKFIFGTITEEEKQEYSKLEKDKLAKPLVLADVMQHDSLYKAYPQLKDIKISFDNNMSEIQFGNWSPSNQTITLNGNLSSEQLRISIAHEIQHAIQSFEGFASGASFKYWSDNPIYTVDEDNEDLKNAKSRYNKVVNELKSDKYYDALHMAKRYEQLEYDYFEGKLQDWEYYSGIQEIEKFAQKEGYYDLLDEYSRAKAEYKYQLKMHRKPAGHPAELYWRTAGEVEARDTQARTNLDDEQRKNTRPDIDRTDVVFAELNVESLSFTNDSDKSNKLRILNSIKQNIDKISNVNKFKVTTEFTFNEKPKNAIYSYFQSIGGIAYRSDLGTIDLCKSGAKSTVEHGYGKDKLNAVLAIKDVIEKGDIIDYKENYNNDGVDRYIIAAKGILPDRNNDLGKSCYVGVVIKSFPKNQNVNSKFYLHEALIIEEASLPSHADPQNKAESADKLASNINLSQSNGDVNSNNMQNQENNSQDNSERYAVDDVIEENRDLVAIHTLSEDKLLKAIKLGGFPMPSIAVTKDNIHHAVFGDISVIFSKDTIDPAKENNVVYGGDIYSPTYPKLGYKISKNVSSNIYIKAREVIGSKPMALKPNIDIFKHNNLEKSIEACGGVEGFVEMCKNDYGMKQFFLADTATPVQVKQTRESVNLSKLSINEYSFILNKIGKEISEINHISKTEWLEKYKNKLLDTYKEYAQFLNSSGKQRLIARKNSIESKIDNIKGSGNYDLLYKDAEKIFKYQQYGGQRIDVVEDKQGEKKEIDSKVNEIDYENWLNKLLEGIIEKSGIRIDDDVCAETLENIVKAMCNEKNGLAKSQLWGMSFKKYESISDIKADTDRLQNEKLDFEYMKGDFLYRFKDIACNLANSKYNLTKVYSILSDAVLNYKNKSDILRYLQQYYPKTATISIVDDLLDLISDAGKMPTEYFEAKPHRAVGFDEVKAVVAPNNISSELRSKLKKLGLTVYEYEAENEQSRANVTQQAINSTGYVDAKGETHSDLRFAIDDTINDWLGADLLYDEEGNVNVSITDRAIEENPEVTATRLLSGAVKYSENRLQGNKDIGLSDRTYKTIAAKIMSDFEIDGKVHKYYRDELAEDIKSFVSKVQEGNYANFAGVFEDFAEDCKVGLLLSGELDEQRNEEREYILSWVKKATFTIPEWAVPEIKEHYGSIKKYRQLLFGKTKFVLYDNYKAGRYYLDDFVIEMKEQGFGYLMEDIDLAGGGAFIEFEKLLNQRLQPTVVNPYMNADQFGRWYESIDSAAVDMALSIVNNVLDEQAKQIVKDNKAEKSKIRQAAKASKQAQQEQVERLKAKNADYNERWKAERQKRIDQINRMRERLNDEQEKDKNYKERTNKQIAQLQRQLDIKKKTLNIGYEAIREQYNEGRNRTIYRERLGRMLDRMTKKLDGKANNNEYIPENLKQPILEVLSSFVAEPDTYKNGKQKSLPGYFGEWKNIAQIGKNISNLADEYSNIKSAKNVKQDYAYIDIESLAYKDGTMEVLKALKEQIKDKNVFELNADDLKAIYDTMQELDETLRDAVSVIVDGQKMQIEEAAKQGISDVENVKFKKGVDKFDNTALNVAASVVRESRNRFVATSLDPVRYGRFLSGYNEDSIVYKMFADLHEGDKKRIRIMQDAMTRVQAVTSKYTNSEIKSFQRDSVEEFEFKDLKSGKRVKVSQGMLVAIYLTDRQADGHRHLVNEEYNHYTVIPDLDMMNLNLNGKGDKSHRVRLSEADLRNINAYVEKNKLCYEIAGAVSEVYNTVLAKEINEVSMAKYGKLIATVKNYYPLQIYKDGAKYEKNFEAEFNDLRLKSRGFTKQRVTSFAPIMIDDVLKTFVSYVNSTSEYCGMLIPIENFKKV
jgi:hypothetical protein